MSLLFQEPKSTVSPPSETDSRTTLGARVFQNTAAILTGRILSILFSAGAAILLTRYLGSEKLGQLGAIYAYLALFSWLAIFGLDAVLVREISREREEASSILHTGFVLSAICSVATTVLALLFAGVGGYGGHLRPLLAIAAIEILVGPFRLPGVILQVDLKQWYSAGINVFRQGLWLAIVAALVIFKAPLAYVIWGRVVTAIFEAVLLWIYGRRLLASTHTFLPDRARTFVRHCFPIAFTSLLAMIYLRIDQVMLHKMTTDSILGQYVAAVKFSELFELLPSALMSSLAPILSLAVVQELRFRNYLDRSFRYFMVLSAGLCVCVTLGARLIVLTLYGKQFLPAAPLLAVLIWSEVAIFFATVVVNALIASNLQRFLPLPTLLGAVLNIGLNLILIPRFAALGSAWATVASYTLGWMVCLVFFKQTRGLMWQGLRFAFPVSAMALFSVGASSLLPVHEIFRLFTGLVLFGAGIGITRIVRRDDLMYFWTALVRSFPLAGSTGSR